jgi:hypothetical protein
MFHAHRALDRTIKDEQMRFLNSVLAILLAFSAVSCRNWGSAAKDIFTEDNKAERRHKATKEELLWTVYLGGCTGSLLSPKYLITANHCSPQAGTNYTSGSALANGRNQDDMQAVKVVEANAALDYAIVEYQWKGEAPKDQRMSPSVAVSQSDVVYSSQSGQGDEIFSVGFPTDKFDSWGATYAQGQLKSLENGKLVYNMGIINGNSGGAVWRKKDNMLVSLTNNGSHAFGQEGWNNNDIDDPNAWNWGSAMWEIYGRSKILKEIFPDGKNKFLVESIAHDLFVAVIEDMGGTAGSFALLLSAPPSVGSVYLCENESLTSACAQASAGIVASTFNKQIGDRKVFVANKKPALSTASKFVLIGFDASGARVSASAISLQ